MRTFVAAAAALLAASPLPAQQHGEHQHADTAAAHEHRMGELPEGWSVRTDRDQPTEQIMFHAMQGHFHARTGPAAVFFNPAWSHTGDYSFSARFRQNRAPNHPEAYGLVIGGSGLDGPDQTYTYFLVRGTGEYFIAERRGAERNVLVNWTAQDAITRQDPQSGQQTNVLAVRVSGDQVIFSVNGAEVARLPRAEIRTEGIAGFRINHHLDVRIDQVER